MTGLTGERAQAFLNVDGLTTNTLDSGFFWNAFMIDSINLYFIASWDTAQMNDKEVEGHCDALSDVMRKLCDEGNWDKTLSDVFRL